MSFAVACAACLSAACTPASGPAASQVHSASIVDPAAAQSVSTQAPWWEQTGDALLGELIGQGLGRDAAIDCRIIALRTYDRDTVAAARRIGHKLGRLLGDRSAEVDPAVREGRVDRIAQRRVILARRIALAYVEVRRMQQDVALRGGLRDQFKDNAEVAQFRREAGLVPAIDEALARSQDEAALGELGFAQGRLNQALAELARLVDETPAGLAVRLGPTGALPDPSIDPLATSAPDDPRRAALADAVLREVRLAQARDEARRTLRDARTAYREGAGSFANLYVAEAAALGVELALSDARAGRAASTLELWSAQDAGWASAGLDPATISASAPPSGPITVTPACD